MNRSAIMKSIIATGISWNIAGATWAETAASTLFSGKGMAAAVLFAGIIASYLALPSAKPLPTPEPTISTAGDVVAPSPEEETPITIATPSIGIMLNVHNKGIGIAGVYTASIAETKIKTVHQAAEKQGFPLKCSIEPE